MNSCRVSRKGARIVFGQSVFRVVGRNLKTTPAPVARHQSKSDTCCFAGPNGNAVKHFRSRIRENSDDWRAFRILTNSATIRSQAFFRVRKCFTALV
jgi:hypothetical protein